MGRTDLFAGSQLGAYQIERQLGQSPLGAAYIALQPAQGRRVMITTFDVPEDMSVQEHEHLSLSLAREGDVLVRLAHPQILPVYAFGIQSGRLYLVTDFVKEASLGQFLKQNTRFTPEQTLPLLKQLAAGLDYAHSQGAMHGMLSPANIVVSNELNTRIAGFGLRTLLEIQAKEQGTSPSTSDKPHFLGHPEYIAPERLLGLPGDGRSDIYALGVILFELLSGTRPFQGTNPLDLALLRLQQPVPSLHAIRPELPEAFDLVLGMMLERDPARRTQHAGEAAIAFERVIKALDQNVWTTSSSNLQPMLNAQVTLPPTVNWFDEPVIPASQWQGAPTSTDPLSDMAASAGGSLASALPSTANSPNSLGGVDPFAWWTGTSAALQVPSSTSGPGTFSQRPATRRSSPGSRSRPRPAQQDRRRLVTLIVAGTTAAGFLTLGGIGFAHFAQNAKQAPLASGSTATTTTGTTTTSGNTPPAGTTATSGNTSTPSPQPGVHKTPTTSKSPTAQPQPSPTKGTQGAQPTPTPKPQPQPTATPVPSHTGTVIGHTNMGTNSAVNFTNPADGRSSLLIHLPNGNFVACERACTHEGVPVNYNAGSQKIVCPAHDAVFDPQSFAHLSGPGGGSLPKVTIRVNADGTITTG